MGSEMNGTSEQHEGLPPNLKKSSVDAYGWRVITFPGVSDPVAQVEKVRNLKIREDDILLMAYPKCGTNWMWEIIQMLLRQTAEYEKRTKGDLMLESAGGPERAEAETARRILNSHDVFAHLPQEIITKKTKIVHVIRNPKDALVSLFCHCKHMFATYQFSFSTLFEAAIDDKLAFPSQIRYLHQMSEFQINHPDHPIKHVYYEDMKKDLVKTVKDVATFLNVPASDELCQNIALACNFDNIKQLEENNFKDYPTENIEVVRKLSGKLHIFRRGIVGDWKNHFTVSQNERFDVFIDTAMKIKKFTFTFIYE